MWGGMMWPLLETTPKTITIARNFVFITLGTLNRPDLHFEGAGNGPVVITWISREHELYSGASPILLVEHCVTFGHDRRLLSLLGFVHNWPTNRWSATKKENRFSLNGNGIMSSFLGRQFYHSTRYYCSWDIDTCIASFCDLKSTQMNRQCHLIQELYEFALGHNTAKATKNICCSKGEGAVDHNTITRGLKKFWSGFKNLNN